MTDRAVVVRVRDPAAVTLAAGTPGPGGQLFWSRPFPDGARREAVIAAGAFGEGPVASTSYELDAARLDGGAIVLRWTHPS